MINEYGIEKHGEGSGNGLFCGTVHRLFGMTEENHKEHLLKWSLRAELIFVLKCTVSWSQIVSLKLKKRH
jgi:hypothetical protein